MNVRWIVAVGAGVALMAAAADAQDKLAQGEKVYAAQKCSMCHSIAGKGNAKGPLDGVGDKLKADEIRQWLVNAEEMTVKTKAPRKPAMKSYGAKVSPEEMDALVAYMQSLKKK